MERPAELPLLEVENLSTSFFTEEGVVPAVDGGSFLLMRGRTSENETPFRSGASRRTAAAGGRESFDLFLHGRGRRAGGGWGFVFAYARAHERKRNPIPIWSVPPNCRCWRSRIFRPLSSRKRASCRRWMGFRFRSCAGARAKTKPHSDLERPAELPLLEVENLSTSFFTEEGVVPAVDGVSFSLMRGRTSENETPS